MGLVNRGFGTGLAPNNKTVISTTVEVFDGDGFGIGFIKSLARDDNRPTVDVRHLNKADAGRIVEQQPGIETYGLTATGFAMYEKNDTNLQSLLNRLPPASSGAGIFKTLNQQQIPFALRQEATHPATQATNVTYFLACMLLSFSETYDIGNTQVMQTCKIKPSYIE